MKKATPFGSWFFNLLFLVLFASCSALPPAPAPVNTWTPPPALQSATPMFTETPVPTRTETITLTPSLTSSPSVSSLLTATPVDPCDLTEVQMQAKLRELVTTLETQNSAPNWEAGLTLTVVGKYDVSMNGQFKCQFRIRLWEHSNPLDNNRNVEIYTQGDLYAMSSLAKAIENSAYISTYWWQDSGGGLPRMEETMLSLEDSVGRRLGGMSLYFGFIPPPTITATATKTSTSTPKPTSTATNTATP